MTQPAKTFVASEGEGVMVHLQMRALPAPAPSSRPSSATFQVSAGGRLKETTLS